MQFFFYFPRLKILKLKTYRLTISLVTKTQLVKERFLTMLNKFDNS